MKQELVDFLEELKHNASIPNTEHVEISYVIERIELMLEDK